MIGRILGRIKGHGFTFSAVRMRLMKAEGASAQRDAVHPMPCNAELAIGKERMKRMAGNS